MKIIIVIALLLTGGFFLYRHFFTAKTTSSIKEVTYGPFTIKMERFSTWSFNMNVGREVEHVSISYSVWHKGQPVKFSAKLQTNTGFSHLWRVYILKDAPYPTLIAGSQSLYLICEKNDSLMMTPIEEQSTDFANLQWLDADKGQPTPAFDVFMSDERDGDGKVDTLQGGKYLLVNRHQVLHVPTLKQYPLNVNNEAIDNYGYAKEVLAFSPDQQTIVFPADFQTWNSPDKPKFKKALIAYTYQDNRGYVIPFGKTETRLYSDEAINQEWFKTYFEWQEKDGKLVLNKKKLDRLPFFTGKTDAENYAYSLYPVKPEMQQILLDFMMSKMGWTKADISGTSEHEYTGKVINIGKGDILLSLRYTDLTLSLSKDLYKGDEKKCREKRREITDAFDLLLREGKYQEYFLEIPESESWE
jgi:hypothetical protein